MTAESLMLRVAQLAALDPRSAEAITAVVEEFLALGPERLSQLNELSEQERQDMVRDAFKRHYRGDRLS